MSWDKTPIELTGLSMPTKKAAKSCGRMLSYRDALREAQYIALKEDKRVFIFGEGVDDPTGTFGTTLNFHKEFGSARIIDTPICENTMTGVAIGASLAGLRPILVHMRTDFLVMSMDELINHAAKWKYMFGGRVSVPIVIRAIIGGGWGSSAQHSQPLQALFAHIPGLKIVMPATAYDAKGLLLASLQDNGPIIFIEHRWLYDHKGQVPAKHYCVPIGKAALRKEGKDITLISSSFMSSLAFDAAQKLNSEGIDAEVLDLRTIKPLDYSLILESVAKTKRAVVLDFGYKFSGISAEISSFLMENAFGVLKAPVARIALPDVPTPASQVLEKAFYPSVDKIVAQIKGIFNKH